MRNYNHSRCSDKFWPQGGRLFHQKVVIFPSFSSVTMIFFSLISFIELLHQKNSKSLMMKVAKVLKLTLSSVKSLKSLTSKMHECKSGFRGNMTMATITSCDLSAAILFKLAYSCLNAFSFVK